jgi:perosamine synthetase
VTGPLALDGGTPVRATFLPYGRQTIDQEDIDAVVDVLRSDWLTTGPHVGRFEETFASRVGARHAVAVSNGTAALHAAAFGARLGPGDEVIVPALTFAASANCVRYVGADVVFVDVRPDTLTIDPAAVEAAVTSRTRAIITVDFAGHPCDFLELEAIASRRELTLIDDAAHALGARYRGRPLGAIGDITTFSFHPVKHVTMGEGGVVTTGNDDIADRLRRFRNHGITSDHRQREKVGSWFYEMVDLGFNYRITDFQCALGTSQMAKLDASLARRRSIAARYQEAFARRDDLDVPVVAPDREPAWHLYTVRLRLDRLRVGRADVFRAMRAENIGVNVHYIPVPWHPYYQQLGYRKGQWPITENAYERLLSLPMWPGMSDADAEDVIVAMTRVLDWARQPPPVA